MSSLYDVDAGEAQASFVRARAEAPLFGAEEVSEGVVAGSKAELVSVAVLPQANAHAASARYLDLHQHGLSVTYVFANLNVLEECCDSGIE